jgi:hypothetical protein
MNHITPQKLDEPDILPETFVKIKTGNQTFVTKPSSWKGKSLYFDQLFSGRWNDKSPDGS